MEIIVYVNKDGNLEGDCSFKAIDLCVKDEQSLFLMLKHSLGANYVFEPVHVLTEYECQKLIKYRNNHPEYIKYKEAKEIVEKFEDIYM